ncbi:MAG TPA: aminomethyl-transferring glycine dehydrogenase subunit GcvPB [Solirubrobacteraceae bacterium]|jgi:glycine dehydrogenase subunit 2|nr:aminomethyl-transferring glycine dehydrogenase subunit GcvPB [Solirubrobacteraceae bacterium]
MRPPAHNIDAALQREPAVTIFQRGAPGRRAFQCPEPDVPDIPLDELLPAHLRRSAPPRLPEVSEPEIVRHYVRLSKRNFDLDSGFYPLGSCTMKHNPRLHERVAALPGHARLHPLQDPERAQGALELMWNLERALSEISGLPHVCLQPSAGSHGELAGVLLTRAYHESRGETRHKVLTPDTAHGTNPATVTMAGFEVVKIATNPEGGVDLDDLRAKADTDVACLMLTNPNTLGLFDSNIQEIARIVHEVGATLYYDGANLNAVMGLSRPGDMGFDIVHFNLHKSFTQPHGGGGPGSGPIAVSDRIEPFLPVPRIARSESSNGSGPTFDLVEDWPGAKSIGRLRGFQGNYGCFVRSYAYIRSLGAPGLKDASETAVLNANYLLARLRELGVSEHLPLAYSNAHANPSFPPDKTPANVPSPDGDNQALANVPSPSGDGKDGGGEMGLCLHEFVLSGGPMKRNLKIKTLDLAKRLLDYGYHPPTVYFPLLVEEALMVEPTETETKETLDGFAEALAELLSEAAEDPEIALNAPYTTPVRRLDEVGAAKNPVIRQKL